MSVPATVSGTHRPWPDEPAVSPPPRQLRRGWWLAPVAVAVLVLPGTWSLGLLAVALAARFLLAAARAQRTAAQARAGTPRGGIVLGVEASGRRIVLSERQLTAHGLILGASGAGKTTTLLRILTAQIERGRPVVAIDLKGSPTFARELRDSAAAAGRPFRLWTPEGPSVWNPLAHGGATELKDKLIATERFTEPHYQRAAERYLQIAVQVMHASPTRRPVTLDAVVDMLEPARLAVAARDLPPARAERVREYLAGLTPDALSAVRGMAARLAIISESDTGRYLTAPAAPGTPVVDLRAALAGDAVVLFSLNSSTFGKLSAQLGTLAVQDLVAASGHRLASSPHPPHEPALVGIDEFSALGSDNLVALLARGREAGVSVLLATQELADLERAARGMRDQILGNTSVKIAHRQDVPGSAETVARMIGTVRVWERTYHLQPGMLGISDRRRGTLRQIDQFAIDPNRIRTLGTGEAVVIVKTPHASARVARITPPQIRDGRER